MRNNDKFDVGQDFQDFLDQQQNQDPNKPQGGTDPVNQNPLFDPGTNITPGQDIKLKQTTPLDVNLNPGGVPDQDRPYDPINNPSGPRERAGSGGPGQTGNPDNPSPEAGLGPKMTPPRPTSPTPVAGGPGQPSTPLPAPDPLDMIKPQQFDMLGKGSLLGSAGGLLGGGLGVGGNSSSMEDNSKNSDLLPYLLQLLNQR